jgi:hypothetical protein
MTSLTVLGWQIRQGCQPRLPRQQDTSVRCRCSMQAWLTTAVLVKIFQVYIRFTTMSACPVWAQRFCKQPCLLQASCSHVLQERAPGKGKNLTEYGQGILVVALLLLVYMHSAGSIAACMSQSAAVGQCYQDPSIRLLVLLVATRCHVQSSFNLKSGNCHNY